MYTRIGKVFYANAHMDYLRRENISEEYIRIGIKFSYSNAKLQLLN